MDWLSVLWDSYWWPLYLLWYLVSAIGLWCLCRAGKVPHPWMCWIPLVQDYQAGWLADSLVPRKAWLLWKILLPVMRMLSILSVPVSGLLGLALVSLIAGRLDGNWFGILLVGIGSMLLSILGVIGLRAAERIVCAVSLLPVWESFYPTRKGICICLTLVGLEGIAFFRCAQNISQQAINSGETLPLNQERKN